MLTYRHGVDAKHGGVDLVISLTAEQAGALGEAAGELAEALSMVLDGLAALRLERELVAAGGPARKNRPVSAWEVPHDLVLQNVAVLTSRLDGVQAATVRAHAQDGGSYGSLALAMGVARSTAQTRRDEVLDNDPGAGELWATGEHAPVDHPGVKVPANMRDWSTPWPAYLPVDITPPELRGAGLAASVAEGWAEPDVEPEMPDVRQRRARALVPFHIDDRWLPLNPLGRTGRTGQNFGGLGEIAMADAIVVAGDGEDRQVLLIRRGDVDQWGTPGGRIEPGEAAWAAQVRELREETGVDLAAERPMVFESVVIDDWRNTDRAWAVSTPGLFVLDKPVPATGADDATDARWWPFADIDQLAAALESEGGLYEPHRPLLNRALEHLAG